MEISDIKLLELELHSYCNRQCDWCPNSYIDRKSTTTFLDNDVFNKLMHELKDKGFNGVISFSRYNEPFSKPKDLEESIFIINSLLPKVKLVANTNGDYNYERFKHMVEITEMDYDHNKTPIINDNFRIMRLTNIGNRGGALENIKKNYVRTTPCYEPQRFIGINYDGTVSPCCNIRNDIPKHKPFIMGDLNEDTLENILNYPHNQQFRERVASGNPDYLPLPCRSCDKEPGRYTSNEGIGGKQT